MTITPTDDLGFTFDEPEHALLEFSIVNVRGSNDSRNRDASETELWTLKDVNREELVVAVCLSSSTSRWLRPTVERPCNLVPYM